MSKSLDEAWDYFDLLAKNAQVWVTTERIDKTKPRPIYKGSLYRVKEDDDVSARLAKLTRKVEAMELSKVSIEKTSAPIKSNCGICETNTHLTKDCPTIPVFQEVLHEQTNVANAYQRPFNSPYSKTYNPNWRNHSNFSWRNGPSTNEPQRSSHVPYVPPHKKTLEDTLQALIQSQATFAQSQATFVQRQDQINQNTMENIQKLKNSVDRIEAQLNVREKGMIPAQPQPNPRTQGRVNEVKNIKVKHAKSHP